MDRATFLKYVEELKDQLKQEFEAKPKKPGDKPATAKGQPLNPHNHLSRLINAQSEDQGMDKPVLPFLEALFRAVVADRLVSFISVVATWKSLKTQSEVCKSLHLTLQIPDIKEEFLEGCCNKDTATYNRILEHIDTMRKKLMEEYKNKDETTPEPVGENTESVPDGVEQVANAQTQPVVVQKGAGVISAATKANARLEAAMAATIEKLEKDNVELRAQVLRLTEELVCTKKDLEITRLASSQATEASNKVIEVLTAQNDRFWGLITKLATSSSPSS